MQKIIRNESNLDRKLSNRHYVTVTIDDVVIAIGNLDKDVWTTHDVAEVLGVKEHAIRATIRWLKRRRLIRKAGSVRRISSTDKEYWPTTYEIVMPECDIVTLERVFCYG